MHYYQDDKAVDPPKKRTPKQIEDEWTDLGKSLKKLSKKLIKRLIKKINKCSMFIS